MRNDNRSVGWGASTKQADDRAGPDGYQPSSRPRSESPSRTSRIAVPAEIDGFRGLYRPHVCAAVETSSFPLSWPRELRNLPYFRSGGLRRLSGNPIRPATIQRRLKKSTKDRRQSTGSSHRCDKTFLEQRLSPSPAIAPCRGVPFRRQAARRCHPPGAGVLSGKRQRLRIGQRQHSGLRALHR